VVAILTAAKNVIEKKNTTQSTAILSTISRFVSSAGVRPVQHKYGYYEIPRIPRR